jgi:UDP:flavonoid glycosyltransferase YjiC (YdhE family)
MNCLPNRRYQYPQLYLVSEAYPAYFVDICQGFDSYFLIQKISDYPRTPYDRMPFLLLRRGLAAMSRILFAWELGANLGHLSRDLPVAEGLRDAGHDVCFAVRDTRAAAEILEPCQFEYFQSPACTGRTRLAQPPANYAELLAAEGWCDRKALLGYLRAWSMFLTIGQFDAVVSDHAPGALVASRIVNCAAIPLGNGFEIPPDCEPMPSIRPWENHTRERLLSSEQRVLADINATSSHLGGRIYERLGEIFSPSPIFASFAELDHYGARRDGCYVGSIHGLNKAMEVPWPPGNGARIVAYLRPHHRATADVMAAICESGSRAVCVIPDAGDAIMGCYSGETVSVFDSPVALGPLFSEADALIGYASIGTMTEALLAGVPLLMIPTTVEQYLVAKRVEAIGAGIVIDGEIDKFGIAERLATLLGCQECRDNALRFAARYAAAGVQQAANHVVRLILERINQ